MDILNLITTNTLLSTIIGTVIGGIILFIITKIISKIININILKWISNGKSKFIKFLKKLIKKIIFKIRYFIKWIKVKKYFNNHSTINYMLYKNIRIRFVFKLTNNNFIFRITNISDTSNGNYINLCNPVVRYFPLNVDFCCENGKIKDAIILLYEYHVNRMVNFKKLKDKYNIRINIEICNDEEGKKLKTIEDYEIFIISNILSHDKKLIFRDLEFLLNN